jgi:hypothetical protein
MGYFARIVPDHEPKSRRRPMPNDRARGDMTKRQAGWEDAVLTVAGLYKGGAGQDIVQK